MDCPNPKCRYHNQEGMNFCIKCGTPLKKSPSLPKPIPRTAEVQRRQLSVLFCDLVGSTTLSEQVDPEELRELVQDYQRVCGEAIARFEGHIAQYLGDGIVVYFGYPTAHEDDARRAVHSALGILAGMKQLNVRLQAEKNLTLAVRIGIDTGTVVVEEEVCFGETPNIAARLQNLAAKNGIVISASTRKLVGSFFDCKDLGEHLLKGISQPMLVYEVLQARDIYRRLEISRQNLTPFVNRKQELNTLLEIWEQVKSGQGQVVLLFGEAGLGKSRLVQEFEQRITIESYALRECYCSSYYQDTAFYPLLDMLRNISVPHGEEINQNKSEIDDRNLKKLPEQEQNSVQIPESDRTPSEQRPKIESLFDSVLSLVSPDRAALYPTPQQKKQNLLSVIEQMLLNLAAQLPVLMVVEDLHWSDHSTLELLGLLVEQIPNSRILLLTTARSEFDLPWSALEQVSQIQLNRLFEEIEPIARGVVGGKKLPDELIYLLKLKTDGIPLFVEEMTRMVLESGWLTETEDAYRLNMPIHSLAIPTTLQDMLMARLDRLEEGKEIIQIGATIGREFSYELLQIVSDLDDATLQRGLARLEQAQLLFKITQGHQTEYRFKDALIQKAAYESLLKSTRQQYHQKIVEVLEQNFPGMGNIHPEFFAQHYTKAGNRIQAIRYWHKAGEKAFEAGANQEAIAHWTKALEMLKKLPNH